ncbi:MAG: putative Ig domain-containing protein, partial [Candidatus Paceibacterota bacterium]
CGTSANPAECTRCDLFKLFKNIIDFVLVGLMPPVAAILFVWGGFLILMGGANPGNITQGRTIFWNTFMGVVIISASWLLTNTVIRSLAVETVTINGVVKNVAKEWWKFECREVVVSPPPITIQPPPDTTLPPIELIRYGCNTQGQCVRDPNGQYTTLTCNNFCQPASTFSITISTLADGIVGQQYNQVIQVSGGVQPYAWTQLGSLPAGLNFNTATGVIFGTPTTTGTSNFTIRVTDNSSPLKSAEKQFSITVTSGTLTCGQSWEQNLCQPRSMTCGASACSQYASAINQYAVRTGVSNGANFLKAIMIKESACNINADSGHAQGLMQLKPSTANIYKSRCGVTENITSTWLKTPANANASICIAAEFMRALTQTPCGSTPRGVSAGYNGGSGACQQSKDCSNQTSCAGGPTQRWECLYDNPQQNICNTGYAETRDYATKVLYCYNNPGF